MDILSKEHEHINMNALVWTSNGKAFQVVDKEKLVELILPLFFKETPSLRKFLLKLKKLGFQQLTNGPDRGAFYHICFQRDKLHLLYGSSSQQLQSNFLATENSVETTTQNGPLNTTKLHNQCIDMNQGTIPRVEGRQRDFRISGKKYCLHIRSYSNQLRLTKNVEEESQLNVLQYSSPQGMANKLIFQRNMASFVHSNLDQNRIHLFSNIPRITVHDGIKDESEAIIKAALDVAHQATLIHHKTLPK